MTSPRIIAVCASSRHEFSKGRQDTIRLRAGLGVEGDTHSGTTVQHRSRVAVDPTQPNLRQVHLVHSELLGELRAADFRVEAGSMGENITTQGIELLALPQGTKLHLGPDAILEITGLRNPCVQLDRFQKGLMAAVLDRDENGKRIRKAGVMAIVLVGGEVRPGDVIEIDLPPLPHRSLEPV